MQPANCGFITFAEKRVTPITEPSKAGPQSSQSRCSGPDAVQEAQLKLNVRLGTFLVLVSVAAQAQSSRTETISVHGEIAASSVPGGLSVELSGTGAGFDSTFVNGDNSFDFRSVTPGVHELRVVGSNGQVLDQEYVSITPNQTLSIRLPEQTSTNHSNESTVSLQQLRHKVSPAVQKVYEKGERAAAKGDMEQARACFEETVAKDPEFADAYNELGAVEAGMNHLPEAEADFQKAIDLVPEHLKALPNLTIVLAKMERFHEAGQVARRALQVAPGDGRVHYILAASMLAEHGDTDQIIAHLERAVAEVPSAHLTVAELLAQRGRLPEAIHHLEDYLAKASPGDSLRPKVEARLAQLRQ
jgi:Flp pilus assembly protein TadD